MPVPSAQPLSDDEIAEYSALIHTLGARAELPLTLEGIDGFTTALLVAPRLIMPSEYLPVLFEGAGLDVFENENEMARFMDCFTRRWNEIADALNAPVENLGDPRALSPLILDWEALLEDLPAAERAEIQANGVLAYAELWAFGFLQVVESWEEDWVLPEGSKDEAFVDECLNPFYTLVSPEDEWTADERRLSRYEHVASAIWGAYDLREFWRDRGFAPRTPIRKAPTPGRNDPCPCGSGKKYKKCCGADPILH